MAAIFVNSLDVHVALKKVAMSILSHTYNQTQKDHQELILAILSMLNKQLQNHLLILY